MRSLLFLFMLTLCSGVSAKDLAKTNNHPIGNSFTANNKFSLTADTVTDIELGLMWKKCSEGQSNSCKGKAYKYDWLEARRHAQKEVFSGYNNWRLPTQSELRSLRYCSNKLGITEPSCAQHHDSDFNTIVNFKVPTIRVKIFPNTHSDGWYWSSTSDAKRSYNSDTVKKTAVCVEFSDGYYPSRSKNKHGYVRLVRNIDTKNIKQRGNTDSILSEDNRLELNAKIVIDPIMNIMWKKCSEGQKGSKCRGNASIIAWNNAFHYARESNFEGYTDWRLPTSTEIRTLRHCSNGSEKESINCGLVARQKNESFHSPTIQKKMFPNTRSNLPYWTSSMLTRYDLPNDVNTKLYNRFAKVFSFRNGSYFSQEKVASGYLRLVRTLNNSGE